MKNGKDIVWGVLSKVIRIAINPDRVLIIILRNVKDMELMQKIYGNYDCPLDLWHILPIEILLRIV